MGKAADATPKERKGMKASIFCGPGRTFPIEDQGDVNSAARLIGKAKNKASVISCIKGKAKANGFSYPDSWDKASASTTAGFSLPSGWTYEQLRGFLQSELSEDKPALPAESGATDDQDEIGGTGYYYPMIVDFDDGMVVFRDDWDDDLFQATYKIKQSDAGKDVTWGTVIEVFGQTIYKPIAEMATERGRHDPITTAQFSLDNGEPVASDSSDAYVIRRGVVLEAANYEDKGINITPEHLMVIADQFSGGVMNRVNHATGDGDGLQPSYFDGDLGTLESLEFGEDGGTLFGVVKIPTWFDDYHRRRFPDEPLKNSLEIDIDNWRVTGNTLVPNPRVSASALMSARAEFSGSKVKDGDPMGKTGNDKPAETQTVSMADFQALQEQNKAQSAQIAALAETNRKTAAESWATELVRGGKQAPAMKSHLVNMHLRAAEADAKIGGTVSFAKGAETVTGTRVEELEAAFAAMPASVLMRELADGDTILPQMAMSQDAVKKDHADAIAEAKKNAEARKAATSTNGR